jgi:hypothetical protein
VSSAARDEQAEAAGGQREVAARSTQVHGRVACGGGGRGEQLDLRGRQLALEARTSPSACSSSGARGRRG